MRIHSLLLQRILWLNLKKQEMQMSKKDDYVSKTEKIAAPICEELGFELVDVEFVKEAGY